MLEDPLVLFATFQASVAQRLEEAGFEEDLADELIAERAAETLSD